MRFITNTRATVDYTMRVNDDAISQKYFITDHDVGADVTTFADECPGADYGRGMNLSCLVLN